MVQKSSSPRRGRPRAYDPERALEGAMTAFWRAGFAGTSLDDLSASTAMNRPSLYAAFGDKQALYLKTIERYVETAGGALEAELAMDRPLPESLRVIYRRALDLYQAGSERARGCYITSTAVTAALDDPAVRQALTSAYATFDRLFAAGFERAREAGELAPDAPEPALLGSLAMGLLHTLAVRTRAGASRAQLDAIAAAGVAMLCGGAPRAPARARRR